MEIFGEHEIIKLLKHLDKLIDDELEIILCGGAAGILKHTFSRSTLDIDLIASIPKISQFEKQIKMVADKYSLSEKWLNDAAKGYVDFLPKDFRKRLESFEADFKFLKVFMLSNVDLCIMKLAAFRPEDIQDLQSIKLLSTDKPIIRRTITRISKFDGKTALKMKLFLKEAGIWKT